MPRVALHSALKNLRTYEVLLTETTQEELWEHFSRFFSTYKERFSVYIDMVTEKDHEIYCKNPFLRNHWRNGSPEMLYQDKHPAPFLLDTEDGFENYDRFRLAMRDLEYCMKYLHWNDDEEYKALCKQWVEEYQEHTKLLRSAMEELARTELAAFQTAKRRWEEDDKEWILLQKSKQEHSRHHPRSYWVELFATDEWAKRRYDGIIPDNEETCEMCKSEIARKANETRLFHLRLQQEKEEDEEWLRQHKAKKELRNFIPTIQHECKLCEFQTENGEFYDLHLTSKDHVSRVRLNALRCNACSTQCTSQKAYDAHCGTAKHKKIVNDGSEKKFVCEPCNYTTDLKQRYDQHCATQKHVNKVA